MIIPSSVAKQHARCCVCGASAAVVTLGSEPNRCLSRFCGRGPRIAVWEAGVIFSSYQTGLGIVGGGGLLLQPVLQLHPLRIVFKFCVTPTATQINFTLITANWRRKWSIFAYSTCSPIRSLRDVKTYGTGTGTEIALLQVMFTLSVRISPFHSSYLDLEIVFAAAVVCIAALTLLISKRIGPTHARANRFHAHYNHKVRHQHQCSCIYTLRGVIQACLSIQQSSVLGESWIHEWTVGLYMNRSTDTPCDCSCIS